MAELANNLITPTRAALTKISTCSPGLSLASWKRSVPGVPGPWLTSMSSVWPHPGQMNRPHGLSRKLVPRRLVEFDHANPVRRHSKPHS